MSTTTETTKFEFIPVTALHGLFSVSLHKAVDALAKLTPAQLKVARLMASGRTNKEIALYLDISPKTLDIHRAAVQQKLGHATMAKVTKIVMAADLHRLLERERRKHEAPVYDD